MSRILVPVVLGLVYLLHNDLWWWRDPTPRLFGLPASLWWHIGYCFAVSVVMVWIVRTAWPEHLEVLETEPPPDERAASVPVRRP